MSIFLTAGKFLLGGLGWLKDAISAAFRWAVDNPAKAGCIVLLCASLWLLHGKREALADLTDMTALRDAEKAAHAQTVINYRTAAKAAENAAEAEKKRKEALYAKAAHESDQAYADLRARYRSVLQRAPGANSSGADQTDLPVSSGAPRVSVEAASGAGVLVSRDDALICADNTAYAQAAFEWAEKVAATRGAALR